MVEAQLQPLIEAQRQVIEVQLQPLQVSNHMHVCVWYYVCNCIAVSMITAGDRGPTTGGRGPTAAPDRGPTAGDRGTIATSTG